MLISPLLNKYSHSDIPCFVIGDFNADPRRKKSFDSILDDFIHNESLLTLDFINSQKLDFTYSNYNNLYKGTSIYKANLDHCLYRKNSNDLKVQCNIVDDFLNTRDHRSISLDIFLSYSFYARIPRIPDVFGWETGKVDFSDQNLVRF